MAPRKRTHARIHIAWRNAASLAVDDEYKLTNRHARAHTHTQTQKTLRVRTQAQSRSRLSSTHVHHCPHTRAGVRAAGPAVHGLQRHPAAVARGAVPPICQPEQPLLHHHRRAGAPESKAPTRQQRFGSGLNRIGSGVKERPPHLGDVPQNFAVTKMRVPCQSHPRPTGHSWRRRSMPG